MPRTREQLQQALADTEAWLDSLDPEAFASPDSDGADLRSIGEALRAVAVSDLTLAVQVAKARAHGRTWTQIPAVLSASKQAARERFGNLFRTDAHGHLVRSTGRHAATAVARGRTAPVQLDRERRLIGHVTNPSSTAGARRALSGC
jgi:hypothetical protein